jgi:hypothetical protein
MKVAFYKSKRHLFNRLVSWWTKGDYSHVELVLDGSVCASSSHSDGGVRYKRIELSNCNWDVFEIAGFDEQYARAYINSKMGKGYDYLGLFGFVFDAVRDNKNREFCSELVMGALGFDEPWRFSPNDCKVILSRYFVDC